MQLKFRKKEKYYGKSPFEEFAESNKKERLRREKEAEEIIANFPKMVKSFIIRLGSVLFFVAAIILAYLSSKELLEQRELFSVEKYYNLYLLIMTVVLARWISQSIKEVSKAIVDVVDKLRKTGKKRR